VHECSPRLRARPATILAALQSDAPESLGIHTVVRAEKFPDTTRIAESQNGAGAENLKGLDSRAAISSKAAAASSRIANRPELGRGRIPSG
jgi:hypothetical protein